MHGFTISTVMNGTDLQRRAIRLWAVALREEARSIRQGVSHSLNHLDERLRLKLHLWMHG